MMLRLTDRYRVFGQHIENKLTDTTKQTDKATLTRKYNIFVDVTAILQSAFFVCVLIPANNFSEEKPKVIFILATIILQIL